MCKELDQNRITGYLVVISTYEVFMLILEYKKMRTGYCLHFRSILPCGHKGGLSCIFSEARSVCTNDGHTRKHLCYVV